MSHMMSHMILHMMSHMMSHVMSHAISHVHIVWTFTTYYDVTCDITHAYSMDLYDMLHVTK